jgi:hypothetical protein
MRKTLPCWLASVRRRRRRRGPVVVRVRDCQRVCREDGSSSSSSSLAGRLSRSSGCHGCGCHSCCRQQQCSAQTALQQQTAVTAVGLLHPYRCRQLLATWTVHTRTSTVRSLRGCLCCSCRSAMQKVAASRAQQQQQRAAALACPQPNV